jgi:sulfotransferase
MPDSTIEIINGREGRRRGGVEETLRIVAETHEAGATVGAVAARHDVYPSLLRTWRRQVRDSTERLLRQNRFELLKIFDLDPGGTIYSRAEGLTSRSGMVGFALNALKQAMHSPKADRLLLLSYETLTREPAFAMQAIYDFTGLPPYQHDLDNVVFDAAEFDARLGTPGLHTVAHSVRPVNRQTLLPPDLWRRYENECFRRDPAFNRRGVPLI